ncbi:DHH family phosphoesterase [Patescibacteria group bacterium]|nr:DHH family phosphoesterase [Patescibacteria group bacterium]
MENNTFSEVKTALANSNHVLIPLHFWPDGDSFGSALASYYILQSMGKNPTVVCADTMGSFYDLLPEYKIVNWETGLDKMDMSKYDTLLALDSTDLARYTKDNKINFTLPPNLKIINLDHHPGNSYFVRNKLVYFGGVNYVDTTASSTSEIIYQIFREGRKFSGDTPKGTVLGCHPKILKMILLGILSDTGHLKWKISPKLLGIVAELISTVDYQELSSIMLYNYPKENKKYLSIIYHNLKFNDEKRFCYSKISHQEYLDSNIEPDKVGGAVDSIKDIRGYDFCFTLNEEEPKRIHVSFRSQKGVDTSIYAKALGGGGHKAASAALLLGIDLEEAERKVLGVVDNFQFSKSKNCFDV